MMIPAHNYLEEKGTNNCDNLIVLYHMLDTKKMPGANKNELYLLNVITKNKYGYVPYKV